MARKDHRSKRLKRHDLANGHRMPEKPAKALKGRTKGETTVQAVRPSTAVSEPYRGTSEVSRAEDYAARAALGIIGSDQ